MIDAIPQNQREIGAGLSARALVLRRSRLSGKILNCPKLWMPGSTAPGKCAHRHLERIAGVDHQVSAVAISAFQSARST